MTQFWNNGAPMNFMLEGLIQPLKNWNYHTFGNLTIRKRRVMARLKGIRMALDRNASDSLARLESSLLGLAQRRLDDEEVCTAVKEYVDDHGNWNLDMIRSVLPHEACMKILSMLPANSENGQDRIAWGEWTTGLFSTRSAYGMLTKEDMTMENKLWKTIWKWDGQYRVCLFLWRVAQNGILTNVKRAIWFDGASPICGGCGVENEFLLHMVRD
ncbi:Ribonuclease H [Quillaja saponaria]|uniref:Ribonuclease H n=1 Tax=Quillaja saponaria TaxID=32244 RepID=A0AAD7L109_QUISA|nr:Ribonuclease H [Quillaja saponaria]